MKEWSVLSRISPLSNCSLLKAAAPHFRCLRGPILNLFVRFYRRYERLTFISLSIERTCYQIVNWYWLAVASMRRLLWTSARYVSRFVNPRTMALPMGAIPGWSAITASNSIVRQASRSMRFALFYGCHSLHRYQAKIKNQNLSATSRYFKWKPYQLYQSICPLDLHGLASRISVTP